jgi:hypothetical protein
MARFPALSSTIVAVTTTLRMMANPALPRMNGAAGPKKNPASEGQLAGLIIRSEAQSVDCFFACLASGFDIFTDALHRVAGRKGHQAADHEQRTYFAYHRHSPV